MIRIAMEPHPTLHASAFTTTFAAALGASASPEWLRGLLQIDAPAPLTRDETVRVAVRDMLRHGGYKPTGRGKPASEYLVRAAGAGQLSPINGAVDACNAVSLHSGLPISLVDLDRAQPPFHIDLGPAGARYVFNASGQEIDLQGLICLWDTAGPCANAVKDAQRAKTDASTRRTLSVVWSCRGHEDRLTAAIVWYRSLLGQLGASTEEAPLGPT